MATTQEKNREFEEAVTCPVCLSRFDDRTKKPKYLVSCCHTVCRSCLDRISQHGVLKSVPCPICRQPTSLSGGVDSLPTNGDKLYLLKLEKPIQENNEEEKLNWCFTCSKKTSQKCTDDKHSVIEMNPQLLNSEIHLNMTKISDQFKTYGKSTIEHRKEIGSRLEKVQVYLSSCQQMIDNFQKENTLRINQLNGLMEGTDLTVSIQKLMQLSISNEEDLSVLKDSKEEGARMESLLRDLKSVDPLPGHAGPIAPMQRIRKELEYAKYVEEGSSSSSEFAVSFLTALSFGNRNSSNPFSSTPLFSSNSSTTTTTTRSASMDGSTSTYFQFPSPARMAFSSSSGAPTSQIPTITTAPPVFRFGINFSCPPVSTPPSLTTTSRSRDVIAVRRRFLMSVDRTANSS